MITHNLFHSTHWKTFFQQKDFTALLEHQATPFFFYDEAIIKEKYHSLLQNITYPATRIYYAMKANYNIAILTIMKNLGAGIDAVSPAELLLAEKIGFSADALLFTANNMSEDEMHFIAGKGTLMNIGSISRLEKFGTCFPGSSVCLRFNTGIIAGENKKVQTGGLSSKFGILVSELPRVLAICERYQLKVVGLHEHTGSGIENAEHVMLAMETLLSLAQPEHFPDLEFVNFGGGLKVPYHPEEKPVDYKELGKNISRLVEHASLRFGKQLKLLLEPGKYLTAESGFLVTQVNTLKKNRERTFAGVNSGFGHLLRPSYYNSYHHIVNFSNPDGLPRVYDICGNLCESGDCFARDREIAEIREGDFLIFFNAGAYAYSMASIYNLRPLPAEILYSEGHSTLVTPVLSADELTDELIRRSRPAR